ncbi:DMC1-like protein [Pelagophyceae sp. CCMP2097]|nr:DMC1-like protein [Pelagophyceae sp. CCMP2097]
MADMFRSEERQAGPDVTQSTGAGAPHRPLGEEEYEEAEPSFVGVSRLLEFGVNASDIAKLTKHGYTTAGLIAKASTRELALVKGLSAERAAMLRSKAQLADPTKGIFFQNGLEIKQRLDDYGPRPATEVFGDSATGKTQLCLTLCVRAQLATDDGGLAGRVLYIDTDYTFRPERIVEIAEAQGLDAFQCLQNIDSVHASSFEQQCEALTAAAAVLADPHDGEYRLVVVDCIIAHLRAEYAGRGELSERQQTLHTHLRHLKQIAEEFKVAVVVTNQVTSVPDAMSFGVSVKACGGPIMAHSTTTKLFLRKGRGHHKKATLTQSPFRPPDDCVFTITKAGCTDVPLDTEK